MSLDSSNKQIVSTNLSYAGVSQDFINNYGLTEFDMGIIDKAVKNNNGQTDFQSDRFVANSQLTPYKKVKQALMELEVRHHAYMEIEASLRRAEIMDRKFNRDIEHFESIGDDISADLTRVDRDKNHYDIGIWQRKLRQSEIEINSFLKIVKQYAPDEESLEYFLKDNPEEERNYWVLRMGKQAALDIIAYGRIGSGNMDSISMMSRDEQIDAITIAIQYSGLVNANVVAISEGVQEEIKQAIANNELDLPMIEDGLEVDVHSAVESKVNGERLQELS
jgi:hypothetical protein